jgi:small subunit ribosomal protein S20
MPHTSSAEKALRQTEKRRERNRATKKAIKQQIKKFLALLKDGTPEQKTAEFKICVKKLDKAASKRVIHKNAASRKKSQLAKKLTAKPVAAK